MLIKSTHSAMHLPSVIYIDVTNANLASYQTGLSISFSIGKLSPPAFTPKYFHILLMVDIWLLRNMEIHSHC